jgi:hypothetical protein
MFDNILGLQDAGTTATKLVQLVRSIKGVTSVLVGQKVKRISRLTPPCLIRLQWLS